jgi:hypothetical protein
MVVMSQCLDDSTPHEAEKAVAAGGDGVRSALGRHY